MPSWDQFIKNYDLPIEATQDFQLGGNPARWAPQHPKQWGYEASSFKLLDLVETSLDEEAKWNSNLSSAISPDAKLLAISFVDNIWIFDINSKELRQKLDGAGKVYFRPFPAVVDVSGNKDELEELYGQPGYMLLTAVPHVRHGKKIPVEKLILWEMDQNGRLFDEEEPVDATVLARKAIDSITSELESRHEWSKTFIETSTLHADFERALSKAAADHRRRHSLTLDNARPAHFGSSPFSYNGKWLLFNSKDESTQQGMRPADELPQVVVWDIEAGKEAFRLCGHTDSIMWSGFSFNNQFIATVSWDGTMRMYNAVDGSLRWVSRSGGQCWTAAFSPDSKHIVWSSQNGMAVKLHNVSDGRFVARLPYEFHDWCRNLTWNYDGKQIALCAGRHALIWRPFDKNRNNENGTISQHYELPLGEGEWVTFPEITGISWLHNGKKLGLTMSEGSYLIWDTKENTKELFKKPKGLPIRWSDTEIYHIRGSEKEFYITVDGDTRVRFWDTAIRAAPSWWEKEQEPSPKKKEFPETGKYVKITRLSQPKDDADVSRASWADNGAGLWTAE